MDAELSPSEEDIDSVANDPSVAECTCGPGEGCDICGGQPESPEPGLPEGGKVIGVLDLDRNLRPDLAWICFGLDRKNNDVHLFVPDGDWPNIFELRGFVDMVVNPEFVLSRLRTKGEEHSGR